jgi:peroxiredoxin
MKTTIVLLLLTSFSMFAQTKDEIITRFLGLVESKKIIQYSVVQTMNDEANGKSSRTANCAFIKAPKDTVTGYYYYVQSGSFKQIYNSKGILRFSPEEYGFKTVEVISKKNQPKAFQIQEIEMNGQKFYAPTRPKSLIFWSASIAGHYFELKTEKDTKKWVVLPDTNIDSYHCQRIRYEEPFIYEGDTSSSNATFCFDKITGILVYTKVWMPIQERDEIYLNFVYDKPEAYKLITRNAFPKGTKFTEKPIDIAKKEKTLLKVGQKAPDWELMNLDDKKISLKELNSKPVFLIFSDIGCMPCMMAIPKFNELVSEYPAIKIVSVFAKDKREALIKLKEKKNMSYDILYNHSKDDALKISKAYHINGVPTYYLIDKKGIIRYVDSGYGDGIKDDWIKEIEKVLIQ